jgi:hypothetical protein
MTIRFNCPKCGELIAFADKYQGKRAKCINCGQLFIIPSKDNETARKVEPPKEFLKPEPGFYREVFINSWTLFTRRENITGLVFITAAVCFEFFTGHTDYSWTFGGFRVQAPCGLIITLIVWGCLFWYYMEIISMMANEVDEMPEVDMGDIFGFIWNVVKSLAVFVFAFIVVELPCILYITISGDRGPDRSIITIILSFMGLFLFPMAILLLGVAGEAGLLLRPDYFFKPIVGAFRPYLVVVGLFIAAVQLQLMTKGYGQVMGKSSLIISLNLLAGLGVQVIAIIAMRSMGLFYRHYRCYFDW